jgi:uncharacterized protein (TIGR02147 family)
MTVFEFNSYVDYLKNVLSSEGVKRGRRAELARFLSCQTSFVSQVLTGRAHLSLEHAILVSEFLHHSNDERGYFLLLVQREKAGSQRLRRHFQEQIDQICDRRQIVRARIEVRDKLNDEDQATYYSMWWYAAIHVLTALPEFQTREEMGRKLGLSPEVVSHALEFLTQIGLVVEKNQRYSMGRTRIHLDARSPLIARHHANWRLKSIDAIENTASENLHYSGLIGISRSDGRRIRSMLLDILQKTEPILRASQEEAAYVMLLDFYEL